MPKKLADSGRVPSHKAIAVAILKNDYQLLSLGFEAKESQYYHQLKAEEKRRKELQLSLPL